VTVVLSGEDIVWVAGYRIADRYKVTGQTHTVLSMRLETHK
jgi:hypothetical protein